MKGAIMGHARRVAHNIKQAYHSDLDSNNILHVRRAVAYAGGRYIYPSYTIVVYLPPKRELVREQA
jgi:hypothetical protein